MHEPAEADADTIESGPFRERAVLAEGGDAHDDEPRIEIRGRDVPALEGARAEVLDDHICRGRESPEQFLALGLAQVERDALAAAALDGPEQRVAVLERTDLAHEVARAGLLDLDDLGTHLAELSRAERRGDARTEIEHAQPFERPGHRVISAIPALARR